jgi:hypothetical protein
MNGQRRAAWSRPWWWLIGGMWVGWVMLLIHSVIAAALILPLPVVVSVAAAFATFGGSSSPRSCASPDAKSETRSRLDRAERHRRLRQQLMSLDQGQKRQFVREVLRWILSMWGAHLASAEELSWRRFWGRGGCLPYLLGLSLVTTAIVLMARHDDATLDLILAVVCAAGLLWGGIALLRTFARHVRLRAAGHTAIAMVVDHLVEDDAGIDRYTSLVDFTTRAGESRRRVPFDYRPPTPLVERVTKGRRISYEPGDADEIKEPDPLPVGQDHLRSR